MFPLRRNCHHSLLAFYIFCMLILYFVTLLKHQSLRQSRCKWIRTILFLSSQHCSEVQLCLTLCDPMDHHMPDFPLLRSSIFSKDLVYNFISNLLSAFGIRVKSPWNELRSTCFSYFLKSLCRGAIIYSCSVRQNSPRRPSLRSRRSLFSLWEGF